MGTITNLTLARKFCVTFLDRAKGRNINSLAATVALMNELQSEFPFVGRWIVYQNEAIGVEFVFADKSTCSTFYDRPGQFCVEPMENYQARNFE